MVISRQGLQADFLRGSAVVLVGLWFVVEIGHDERLRLARDVMICTGRERKNRKYFINTRESSTMRLLPAVDARGGVSATRSWER